jgi:hypothetical protein
MARRVTSSGYADMPPVVMRKSASRFKGAVIVAVMRFTSSGGMCVSTKEEP